MKALLYKEFRLSWHPLCYIFPILFSLTTVIPQYPVYVGLMMVTVTYSLLFLGTKKGKQSNDLYFTACLPVRKKDIVTARFISLVVMQLMALIITGSLGPVAALIADKLGNKPISFNLRYIGVILSFGILAYIFVDACYLLMFYKKGRSITAPNLVSLFVFATFMVVFTSVLPTTVPAYNAFFTKYIWIQFVCLAVAVAIYALCHVFILKKTYKLIENINL